MVFPFSLPEFGPQRVSPLPPERRRLSPSLIYADFSSLNNVPTDMRDIRIKVYRLLSP